MPEYSYAQKVAMWPEKSRRDLIHRMTPAQRERFAWRLKYDWSWRGRPSQQVPDGDWSTCIWLAGRGYGKTATGTQAIAKSIRSGVEHANIIVPTYGDIAKTLLEGEAGILRSLPDDIRPRWIGGKNQFLWPNGAVSFVFSAEEPERLRGPEHELVWWDEIGACRYAQEAWDQMQFGLRLGKHPRTLLTTTPRPTQLIRSILADPSTIAIRGTTYDNRANLAPSFLKALLRKYEGTRLGRQEIFAEILDDNPGALWKRSQIDDTRISPVALPELYYIVVGVDPAATSKEDSDLTGIIVAGVDEQDPPHYYVLDDLSLQGTPDEWGAAVVRAYETSQANMVVGETNQGGEMVEAVIRTKMSDIPFEGVHATRGKFLRAEPISALYEQCVAQGSFVTTARGEIPIESVTTRDRVWTRSGLKRVLWAGQTGVKETLKIRAGQHELFCTAEHPVFTAEENFVNAVELVPKKHTLMIWKPINVQSVGSLSPEKIAGAGLVPLLKDGRRGSQFENSLCLEAPDITTKTMDISDPAAIPGTSCCIAPFGKALTGKYQTAGTSTISTKILGIMPWKIWKRLRPKIITRITFSHIQNLLKRKCHEISANGGNKDFHLPTNASNAGMILNQPPHGLDSVLQPAIVAIGLGSVEKGPILPVYNLTIEDAPEFFVNGILVHNCRVHHVGSFPQLEDQMCQWDPTMQGKQKSPDRMDALVWALTRLKDGGELQWSL